MTRREFPLISALVVVDFELLTQQLDIVAALLLFHVLVRFQLVDNMSLVRRLHCDDAGQSVDVTEHRSRRRTTTYSGSRRRSSVMMTVICLLLITAVIRVDAIHWL